MYVSAESRSCYRETRLKSDLFNKAVYGFNGNHLGWFTNGMLIDHDGYVACAVKDMVTTPNLPSLKSLKSLKPLKSLTELPPLFPLLKNAFGQTNCSLLVASGVA